LCLSTCKITLCSNLSKAFSKSSFRITISFFDWWQRWRNWNVQARQSWIVLPLIKPSWEELCNTLQRIVQQWDRSVIIHTCRIILLWY
jgi:hypothetical protein